MSASHPILRLSSQLASSTAAGLGGAELTLVTEASCDGDARQLDELAVAGERGALIGRYRIRELLGVGGMGAVFLAHDVELDRDVALKLISSRRGQSSRERMRLRAEAQALARLSHPNVVQVYEVGNHDDRTFLAMELVEGPTLGDWQTGYPEQRGLAELLEVYAQAGRGLAAAHAAGLVHRDFKPNNVLIGRDGRVRVVDFGLAVHRRVSDQLAPTETQISDDEPISSYRGGPGTLPYMAPEQAFMGTGDAAADQFSFCVALFEAVYGVRPFAATSVMELLYKLDACEVEFPEGRSAPRWLRRLLIRGLARRPEQRFPSMDALLAELTRERRASWRRAALVGLIASLAAATTVSLTTSAPVDGNPRVLDDDLDALWNAERRVALEQAFSKHAQPWAAGSEAAVISELDAWTQRWSSEARALVADQPSLVRALIPEARSAAALCLDAQREQAAFTIDALIGGDSILLEGAVAAVDALPEPSRCADATATLHGATTLDPGVLLPELRALADASAQRELGRYELAWAEADSVLRKAEARNAAGDPLLLAALRQRGLADLAAGRRESGLADLTRARSLAVRSNDHRSATELSLDLAWAGREHDNVGLRREWIAQARDRAEALAADDRHAELLRVRVELVAALDHLDAGEPERAEALLHDNLAELEALDEGGSLLALDHLHALANALAHAGRHEQAEQAFTRALARAEQVRGHDHPANARLWQDAGALALTVDELELARERLTRANQIRRESLAVGHPLRARSELALAQLELRARDHEAAEAHASAARSILEAGPGDPSALADVLTLLGQLRAAAGDFDGAIEHYERARGLMPGAGLHRAIVEVELGKAHARLGHHRRAVELIEPALPRVANYFGEADAQLGPTYQQYAASLEAIGREQDARALLERTLQTAHESTTRP